MMRMSNYFQNNFLRKRIKYIFISYLTYLIKYLLSNYQAFENDYLLHRMSDEIYCTLGWFRLSLWSQLLTSTSRMNSIHIEYKLFGKFEYFLRTYFPENK